MSAPFSQTPERFIRRTRRYDLQGGGAPARLRRGLIGNQGAEHRHYRASFVAVTGRSMMAEFSVGVASHVDACLRKLLDDEPIDLVTMINDLVRYYAVVTMFKDENPEVALQIGKEITAWIDLAYVAGNILLPLNIPGLPHAKYRRSAEAIEAKILKRRPNLVPNTRIDTKVAVTLRSRQPIRVVMSNRNAKIVRTDVHGTVSDLYAL